jgi:uncharacterized membrane protein YccC
LSADSPLARRGSSLAPEYLLASCFDKLISRTFGRPGKQTMELLNSFRKPAFKTWAPSLRQAARVMAATAVAFLCYQALGLQQGYWAVFTVVIVMQPSLGGTLGAATDRMIGTLAGAILGGMGAALHHGTTIGLGVSLTLVTGVAALGAARLPQLRVAPVTAAIMLLTAPPGISVGSFVLDRILEIALGGTIAVGAMVLIFPARSQALVIQRAAAALDQMVTLILSEAEAIERREALPAVPNQAALRAALAGVETAMVDAERERSSRLGRHDIPSSVPRTLWRLRSDLVLIGRALEEPLPAPAAENLSSSLSALLKCEAGLLAHCAEALRASAAVAEEREDTSRAVFAAAFDSFRREAATQTLDFDAAGRVFGLHYALDRFQHDLSDLIDRINEVAAVRGIVSDAPSL